MCLCLVECRSLSPCSPWLLANLVSFHSASKTPSFVSNLGDLSLKEGSKIIVNSKLIKKSSPGLSSDKAAKSKPTLANGGIVLAPPPPPGSTVFAKVSSSPQATTSLTEDAAADAEVDADEFGDFETA